MPDHVPKREQLSIAKITPETIINSREIKLESFAAFSLLSGVIAVGRWLQWHKCHQECLARYLPVARVAPRRSATGQSGRDIARSRAS